MINKNVVNKSFEDKATFYKEWIGSVDHQIWLMNCGYKFGYPDCCIFDFINDAIIQRFIPETATCAGIRQSKMLRYIDSPPNQYWVPCWNHYYNI